MKIGILYICIGKYTLFWENFYTSCEKYFLTNIEKHYFVITDCKNVSCLDNSNVTIIYQENLGWPYNTLMRFYMFLKIESFLNKMNYLFFFNANLNFVNEIFFDEIVPIGNKNFVAAIHPSFYNSSNLNYTYERSHLSLAYVPFGIGKKYVQGALMGGKSEYFIKACKKMNSNITSDLKQDIVAIWHDESHWNRYILNRRDVKYLSPSYVYPEAWILPFEKKIISIDKNNLGGHNYLRGH